MAELGIHLHLFLLVISFWQLAIVKGLDPTIVSQTQTIATEPGQTISFTCAVENQGTYQVEWWYLEHNLHISLGETIITNASHYTVSRPPGSDGVWNLRISQVSTSDDGVYACKIAHTDIQQTYVLQVEGAPTSTLTNIPAANFTDCCYEQGVSSECLSACVPTLAVYDDSSCGRYLPHYLLCGSDGRNHAPCCVNRGVPDFCLGYCVNDEPSLNNSLENICLANAAAITMCFLEGQLTLPGQPTDVTVTIVDATKLRVEWQPPNDNADIVTGYRVFYEQKLATHYNSSHVITGTQSYDIAQLQPDTTYKVYVVAISNHGSSQPSYTVEAVTIQSTGGDGGEVEPLIDCCKRHGMTDMCAAALCDSQPMSANDSQTFACFNEINLFLTCIAHERNSTPCCIHRGVPSHCLGLCQGQAPNAFDEIDCIFDAEISGWVQSCQVEASGSLPSAPTEIHLTSVTITAASVQWAPPLQNEEKVTEYQVLYRKGYSEDYISLVTNSTSMMLENLDEATLYQVKVVAWSDSGSSLPSPSITFITYYSAGMLGPDMTTVAPVQPETGYDVLACCEENNVASVCHSLCSYTNDLSNVSTTVLLQCQNHLAEILMCGSGGRNHTSCCQDRGVSELCWNFCAFSEDMMTEYEFKVQHLPCVYPNEAGAIIECMQEGVEYIPTNPEGVYIANITTHTVSLQWANPAFIPAGGINRYLLQFRKTMGPDDITPPSWLTVDVGYTMAYILHNLEPDTEYEFQLLAVAQEGVSLPSPKIFVRTLPLNMTSPLLPAFNFTSPGDVIGCCKNASVSEACLPGCTGEDLVNILNCTMELPALLQCAADGRNHEDCCRRENVPMDCWGYCRGSQTIQSVVNIFCLPYTQEILTCFHEGYVILPSPPQHFQVKTVTPYSITLSWQPPASNGDDVRYDLYFKEQRSAAINIMKDVSSPFSKSGLSPFTYYELYVIAVNKNGSSQPTPMLVVRTQQQLFPSVTISQDPGGYLAIGDNVTLTCLAVGEPLPTISWILPDNSTSEDIVLSLDRIDVDHAGKYTCIADNGYGGRTSQSTYVKIQYTPIAEAPMPVVSIQPNRGLSVHLLCHFSGYPETDSIYWLFNNVRINPESRGDHYKNWTRDIQARGILESVLYIQAVSNYSPSDYGTYTCFGENHFGDANAHIQLAEPVEGDVTTVEPIRPVSAGPNVTACCIHEQVSQQCMEACSFDIDLSALSRAGNPLQCVTDLPSIIQCAADGRNHSVCCHNNGVPNVCVPFCSGVAPSLGVALLECVQHANTIINCMEEGHQLIPSKPRNVRADLTDEGYIHVEWDQPDDNPDAVQIYRVDYNSTVIGSITREVPASETDVLLSSILGMTTYTIIVTAVNHYGSSHPSNRVTVMTNELAPSSPEHLRGTVEDGINIQLYWNIPARHPGSVSHYKVHFRPTGNSGDNYTIVTIGGAKTNYLISNLLEHTTYEFYVTAMSAHYETLRSNIITMTTSDAPVVSSPSTGRNYIGVSLGVFFGVVVVLVLAGLGACTYLRQRKTGEAYKESVAFENPGYSSAHDARVIGLPTYTDNESKASAIMTEDDASDQGYNTLSSPSNGHVQMPSSSYATLDVSDPAGSDAAHTAFANVLHHPVPSSANDAGFSEM